MVAEGDCMGQHRATPECSGVAEAGRIWEPEPVTAALLAHAGGWDEILMVLAPIAIFAGLLVVANRRAATIEQQREQATGDDRHGRGERPPRRPGAR